MKRSPNPPAPFPPREGGAERQKAKKKPLLLTPPSLGGKGAGGLGLLILLHVILALGYNAITPAATAAQHNPDENAHVAYIAQMASGHLPIFTDAAHGYESHQPPLYYALCLPIYTAMHGSTHAVRLVSTVLGALLVCAAFFCVLTLFPNERWLAFGVAGFAALLPMNVAQSASVTNDALTNLLLVLGLWLLARLATGVKTSPLLLALVLGAGIWTKTSAFLLFPAAALTFYLLARRQIFDVKTASKLALLALGGGVLIGLPWLVRNQIFYGDPLAQRVFQNGFPGTAQASDIARGVFGGSISDYLLGVARWTFASFWGVFDSMTAWWGYPPLAYLNGRFPSPKAPLPIIYNLLLLLCVASFVGTFLFFRARRLTASQSVIVWTFAFLIFLTALAHLLFVLTFFQAQGRYYFPALLPLAFFFTLGFRGFFPRQNLFRVAVILLTLGLLALNVYTIFGLLLPRFGDASSPTAATRSSNHLFSRPPTEVGLCVLNFPPSKADKLSWSSEPVLSQTPPRFSSPGARRTSLQAKRLKKKRDEEAMTRKTNQILAAIFGMMAAAGTAKSDTLSPYVDPKQQTAVAFGASSQWAQPWRAYLETVPASTFVDGTGLCWSNAGDPDTLMGHLAGHGIAHIRLEIGWGNIAYDETKLTDDGSLNAVLMACRKYHIRPLILLNAHQGVPGPVKFFEKTVTKAAVAGENRITLDDASDVVVGRSGLSNLTDYWAAEALVTAKSGNVVTLSKPLPKDIPAGAHVPMATLKYRPFGPKDDSETRRTLTAWARYVGVVAKTVRAALGTPGKPDAGFDLEIWNELTFGSRYLNINNYYSPPLFPQMLEWESWDAITQATADYAAAHPSDFRNVKIGDGFANTIPWSASSKEPRGISAISKHPYSGRGSFPRPPTGGITPLDARFLPDQTGWQPNYTFLFPEYFAEVLQTETITRDMSPIVTDIFGTKHGRYARTSPVTTWITEVNIAPDEDDPKIDAATAAWLKGKTTARYFCFYLSKGVTLMTLYSLAGNGDGERGLGLASDALVARAEAVQQARASGLRIEDFDESSATSPALRVTGNLVAAMKMGLDRTLTPETTRKLVLQSVSDTHNRFQWGGDGTPAHPPLYDRDVFAFLPFQVNKTKFVIPYYVMTRDVRHVYDASKTNGHQFDMPAEAFTLTLTGLRGDKISPTAVDPLTGRVISVVKIRGDSQTLVVKVLASDTPYLLTLEEK